MTPETSAFILQLATIVTPIVLAWIAYQQVKLTRTMVTLEKNTNSIKDALVAKTSIEAHARGVLDERTRQSEINQQVEAAKKIAP